jgi:hypothetical protein
MGLLSSTPEDERIAVVGTPTHLGLLESTRAPTDGVFRCSPTANGPEFREEVWIAGPPGRPSAGACREGGLTRRGARGLHDGQTPRRSLSPRPISCAAEPSRRISCLSVDRAPSRSWGGLNTWGRPSRREGQSRPLLAKGSGHEESVRSIRLRRAPRLPETARSRAAAPTSRAASRRGPRPATHRSCPAPGNRLMTGAQTYFPPSIISVVLPPRIEQAVSAREQNAYSSKASSIVLAEASRIHMRAAVGASQP